MFNSCISHFQASCSPRKFTDVAGALSVSTRGEYTNDLDGASTRLGSSGQYNPINIIPVDIQESTEDSIVGTNGLYERVSIFESILTDNKEDLLVNSSGQYQEIDIQEQATQSTKEDAIISTSGIYSI